MMTFRSSVLPIHGLPPLSVDAAKMPLDHSSTGQTWQGVTDPKLRRQLQNRENQRLSRKRKAAQREATRQALAARRAKTAAGPRPILPKPTGVQPHDTDQPKPTAQQNPEILRAGEGETAVCHHTHQVESQQVLPAQTSPPRVISAFFAAHPDLMDAHTLRAFHYTVTELLPSSGIQTAAREPLHAALYRSAMSDRLTFLSLVAGGASRLRFLTNSIEDSRARFKAQNQIARTVRQQLSAGITTISDTLVFSLVTISIDQNPYLLSLAPEDRYAGDFETPVKSLGGLIWLGLMSYEPNLQTMWMHLLRARNPSLSNKAPGLADSLQSSDMLRASALLQKPDMEMQEAYCLQEEKAAAARPDASEADAFHVDAHFKSILLDIKACCRLIDAFFGHVHPLSPEASEFVQFRNLILYRLLSLPPGVSEICRLTALVFNYAVLYPYPDPRILWKLCRQLGAILSDPQQTTNEDAGLLLWAAMIGGIAAARTVAYDSFVNSVNKFADLLGLEDWPQTVAHLESFIWHERVCGAGGRTLWARARALALSNKSSGYLYLTSRPKAIIEECFD
ncbi:uncharacterized protein LY79DRAFT_572213 [Colletotrichum navitas]|uniref:BZIP domain-containing protein n=1 Tax=Colletotrichum navitas TaxID=681940 RepID=A0AAD8PKE4_9PEZI|nr:uncharacterized protein LY79DRAFT_572213 [Colletotrichum navitas]KAK1566333.1 hypothetical protein LY79DRAFT_572213 [Colletotrichum navitas]